MNRETVLKMDLHGLVQREKQRAEKQQQPDADAVAAVVRKAVAASLTESNRQTDLLRLAQADPLMFHFLIRNRTPGTV